MRKEFIEALTLHAASNSNIVFITGDLGYSLLEPFKEKYPDRFLNVGIAEQNMAGVAAGLALSGKTVFIYSIANFPSLRCLEQIRNDICYHNANVKIISVGSGFHYGTHGYTHHGIEDMSILRTLPNMRVFSPANKEEAVCLLADIVKTQGPCYIRLGANVNANVAHFYDNYCYPNIVPIVSGYKISVLATGSIINRLYNWVIEQKLKLNLFSVPVVKPLAADMLIDICKDSTKIITVEEQQLNGGFGTAIIELLHQLYNDGKLDKLPRIYRYGVEDCIQSDMTSDVFFQQISDRICQEQL